MLWQGSEIKKAQRSYQRAVLRRGLHLLKGSAMLHGAQWDTGTCNVLLTAPRCDAAAGAGTSLARHTSKLSTDRSQETAAARRRLASTTAQ